MSETRISASQFKAHCARVIEQVANEKASVVITKHGQPVAKLVPAETDGADTLFGFARGSLVVRGDVVAPVEEAWDAER